MDDNIYDSAVVRISRKVAALGEDFLEFTQVYQGITPKERHERLNLMIGIVYSIASNMFRIMHMDFKTYFNFKRIKSRLYEIEE